MDDDTFTKLANIQERFYKQSLIDTQHIYDEYSRLLTDDEVVIAKNAEILLDQSLINLTNDWLKFGLHLKGFNSYKQLYFNGYFRSLIPILIIEFFRSEIPLKYIETKISEKSTGVSDYIISKYPLLKDLLSIRTKLYRDMILLIRREKIQTNIYIDDEIRTSQTIQKSVFRDIYRQILIATKFNTIIEKRDFLKDNKLDGNQMRWVFKRRDKKALFDNLCIFERRQMTQAEVGKELGLSQSTISRYYEERDRAIKNKEYTPPPIQKENTIKGAV